MIVFWDDSVLIEVGGKILTSPPFSKCSRFPSCLGIVLLLSRSNCHSVRFLQIYLRRSLINVIILDVALVERLDRIFQLKNCCSLYIYHLQTCYLKIVRALDWACVLWYLRSFSFPNSTNRMIDVSPKQRPCLDARQNSYKVLYQCLSIVLSVPGIVLESQVAVIFTLQWRVTTIYRVHVTLTDISPSHHLRDVACCKFSWSGLRSLCHRIHRLLLLYSEATVLSFKLQFCLGEIPISFTPILKFELDLSRMELMSEGPPFYDSHLCFGIFLSSRSHFSGS